MMRGYAPPDYGHAANARWPYLEAKNYQDWESVLQTFPHLKTANLPMENEPDNNVTGIVIRSGNDDNVHKAIKYGLWTTTKKNTQKIVQLWERHLTSDTETYLFFSAVKSGMFEGVARLKSGYHEETFPFWWENHTLKFKGYFEIEWVYIKDINNKYFGGLYNNEGDEVVRSKDCDMLDSQTTLKMLDLFAKKKAKRNIFIDFAYMDEREAQYIRKMHQLQAYYNSYQVGYGNGFDLSQFSLAGHPSSLINSLGQNNPQPPPGIAMPPAMMKPTTNPQANLGFQMNPISRKHKR